jgi:hypothetical protein
MQEKLLKLAIVWVAIATGQGGGLSKYAGENAVGPAIAKRGLFSAAGGGGHTISKVSEHMPVGLA